MGQMCISGVHAWTIICFEWLHLVWISQISRRSHVDPRLPVHSNRLAVDPFGI